MFRTLMTTRTQKRGVFRSFTKAAEPVCCTSAYTAERDNYKLLPDFFQMMNPDLLAEKLFDVKRVDPAKMDNSTSSPNNNTENCNDESCNDE